MLYTSYFAIDGNNPNAIAISASQPEFYQGPIYNPLAPPMELVLKVKNGQIDHDQYTEQYFATLRKRNVTPEKVLNDIDDQSILLCYEKATDFCHRHLVAQWINQHYDEMIVVEKSLENYYTLLQF